MPLEQLLDSDHQARLVWDFCAGLDLTRLYDGIRSRVGGPGYKGEHPVGQGRDHQREGRRPGDTAVFKDITESLTQMSAKADPLAFKQFTMALDDTRRPLERAMAPPPPPRAWPMEAMTWSRPRTSGASFNANSSSSGTELRSTVSRAFALDFDAIVAAFSRSPGSAPGRPRPCWPSSSRRARTRSGAGEGE
jgi:hypothetical protein